MWTGKRRRIDQRRDQAGTGALPKRRAATKSALLKELDRHAPDTLLAMRGTTRKEIKAQAVFDILYAWEWSKAYGRPIQEYFDTPWGEDVGAGDRQDAA